MTDNRSFNRELLTRLLDGMARSMVEATDAMMLSGNAFMSFNRARRAKVKSQTFDVSTFVFGTGSTLDRVQAFRKKAMEIARHHDNPELLLVRVSTSVPPEIEFWFRELCLKFVTNKEEVKALVSKLATLFPGTKFSGSKGVVFKSRGVFLCPSCSAPSVVYFMDEEVGLSRCIVCGRVFSAFGAEK